MRFNSDLLIRTSRALPGPEGVVADRQIHIPPFISPTLLLRSPLVGTAGGVLSDPQRDSFITERGSGNPASTGASDLIVANFGLGIWEVFLTFSGFATYTQDPTLTPELKVRLAEPGPGTRIHIMQAYAVANIPFILAGHYYWALQEDGWELTLRFEATGVGESHGASLGVVANKLG